MGLTTVGTRNTGLGNKFAKTSEVYIPEITANMEPEKVELIKEIKKRNNLLTLYANPHILNRLGT